MSLHFIFGRAGTGKTTRCCREIQDYLKKTPGGRAYLLVPDQGTYTAEYLLAKSFPGAGFIDVTVCGFSRLAYRVFQELHSPVANALSPLGQQIILRRLLDAHKDKLQVILRAASQPHFSEKLTAFFHQLDMFLVTEDDLLAASQREGETPLGKKLADLSLLYKAYHDYLRMHFAYEGSLFDLLAREIPKSEKLRGSHIWIDGFNGMAPQKIRIVSALVHTAEEVTMTLQMDSPEEAAENPNFARPYQLYSQLQGAIRHSSSIVLTEEKRFRTSDLSLMARHFFERHARARPEDGRVKEGLHLITAESPKEEVDLISRTITSLVRDKGLRYRDILVLSRTPENYSDLFTRSFATYGIPGFIDEKHPMNNHPLVMLTSFLLQFLAKETGRRNAGWQRLTLFRLLKTSLLPEFSQEEIDRLENYVLSRRIRPWQWHDSWEQRSCRDLDETPPPLSEAELAERRRVNEWRTRLTSLLDPLSEAWRSAVSAKDRAAILYRFLLSEKVPHTLSAWDETAFEKTGLRPHLQVWKKVLGLLDEIVHVAGDEAMTAEDFRALFEDGLSALTYSTIPPTLDHVTVTGMDRGYAMEAKVVFIPGVIEGEFPKRVEESGFFSAWEKQALSENSQLTFGNDLMQMIHQEQFFVYLALTRASDTLYLTSPSLGSDGKECEPSFLALQLSKLGYSSECAAAHAPTLEDPDHSFFANPEEALSLLPRLLQEGLPGSTSPWLALARWAMASPHWQRILSEKLRALSYSNAPDALPQELARALFQPGGRYVSSMTRLETYRSCPYKYFLQYGLALEARDEGEIQSLDLGNYLHAGLHQFGSTLTRQKRQWRDASDEDIREISSTIAGALSEKMKYGILSSDATSRYTKRSLDRTFRETLTFLRSWSRRSEFDTKDLEKAFFFHLAKEDGETLTISGKIDRFDVKDDAIAIFDYKTGHTEATLAEIVAGLKLQLLTYLLAVEQEHPEEQLLPAALMYIYLSGNVTKVEQVPPNGNVNLSEKDHASGYVLADPSLLKSLDKDAGESDSCLPVRFTNNGSLHKGSASALTKEQFSALLTIVRKNILSLHSRMIAGDISICPASYKGVTPCSYCPYHTICRFDPGREEESYDYVRLPSDSTLKKELEERAKE